MLSLVNNLLEFLLLPTSDSLSSRLLEYLVQTVPEISLRDVSGKQDLGSDGRGGYARVYRAMLKKGDDAVPVAMKELDVPMNDNRAIKVRQKCIIL